jgi:hypothetical protein
MMAIGVRGRLQPWIFKFFGGSGSSRLVRENE